MKAPLALHDARVAQAMAEAEVLRLRGELNRDRRSHSGHRAAFFKGLLVVAEAELTRANEQLSALLDAEAA